MHLAQVNVSRLLAPIDSPQLAGFVARIEAVNASAEAAPGFVWRYTDPVSWAKSRRIFGDYQLVVNLSVWTSPEALQAFAFADERHAEALRERRSWFAAPTMPMVACWWVTAGDPPSLREAGSRLARLRTDGPGPDAFPLSAAGDFPAGGSVR